MTSHVQITQDSKFAISVECLKEEAKEEINFSHEDKRCNCLQIGSVIFDGCVQVWPKYSKQSLQNLFNAERN